MNTEHKNVILDLANKLSNRVDSLQQDLDSSAQQINNLRAIMFRAAAVLRELDKEKNADIVSMLELPLNNCDGTGCAHASYLENRIDEQQKLIQALEAQVYDYEYAMMTLANQMGVNPLSDDDYSDSGCCPRVIPNLDDNTST